MGTLDRWVPTAANLKTVGNYDVTTEELPGFNHLFQTAPTGNPAEYGTTEEIFASSVLAVIGDWIALHTKK